MHQLQQMQDKAKEEKRTLDKEEFQETGSVDAFRVLKKQFQRFINFRYYFDDDDGLMIHKFFLAYTRTEGRDENQYALQKGKVDSEKILDADLVVTESSRTESEKHVSNSRSRNDKPYRKQIVNRWNDKNNHAEVQPLRKHNLLLMNQPDDSVAI
ncbi:hypothetical protein Tco_0712616 [Tanacetum coccineum]